MYKRLLIIGMLLALASAAMASPAKRIYAREAPRCLNEYVAIVGRTGHYLRDPSQTTGVYTLTDDYNGTITVRTPRSLPDLGVYYYVTGQIAYNPKLREYYVVENTRVKGKSPLPETPKPAPVKPVAGATTASNKKKANNDWQSLALIGGAGVLLLAVIAAGALKRKRPVQPPPPPPPPNGPTVRGNKWGELRVVSGPESQLPFALTRDTATVGRAPGDDGFRLSDPADTRKFSRSQCRIERANGTPTLINTSDTGTIVDGKPLAEGQSAPLHSGSRISFGDYVLEFISSQAPAPPTAGPAGATVGPSASGSVTVGPKPAGTDTMTPLGPVLVVLEGPEKGKRYPLVKDETVIGRDKDNSDLHLSDETVSRRHASIRRETDGFWLINQSEKSITVLNDEQIGNAPVRLEYGSKLRCGSTLLEFQQL